MKKLIIFVLFMLSLTLVLPNNANKVKAYSNNIVLSNSHAESAALGSDVESVFKLESGNDVISFQLTFKYDATKYAFKSLTKLDGLASKPIVNSKNEGIIKVVYSGVKEIVAGSDIFNIVLTVKEDAMEGQDAFITIDEEAENLFSLFTNGEQIDEEVFNTSFKKINIGLYGDVDGDGVVGINDVTKILLHVVGTKELEGKQLQKADINQDGKVNVSDATKIQLYLAKMIDSLIPETIYKVTFLDINGNVIVVREVEKGQAAVAPSAPEVEGYRFTGWDTDFSKVEQDLTVKAIYKESAPQPESIKITGPNEIILGQKAKLTATVYPADSDQRVTWESKLSAGEITSNGIVTGVEIGSFRVRAVSVANPNITSEWLKIVVIEVTPTPSYVDMNGYNVSIMNASSALADINPFDDRYSNPDKIVKQRAWNEVEKSFNCSVTVDPYPNDAPWGPTRINWIINNAVKEQSKADAFIVSSNWISDFKANNAIASLNDYYDNYRYDVPQAYITATSRGGNIYGLPIGANYCVPNIDMGLFYNYGMLQKYGIESPAKLFNDGKWTYSGFKEWVLAAQTKLPQYYYVISGQPYYLWQGMVNAGNVQIADFETNTVNLFDSKVMEVAYLLQELKGYGSIDPNASWNENSGSFMTGTALLGTGFYWFINSPNRWPETMWGDDTEFGFVPFPYPDDFSKENVMVPSEFSMTMVLANGRDYAYTYGVNQSVVTSVISEIYYLTKKYLDESSIDCTEQIRYALESKFDDPESVEAALWFTTERTLYDGAYTIYSSIGASPLVSRIKAIVLDQYDYVTTINEVYDRYVSDFQKVAS